MHTATSHRVATQALFSPVTFDPRRSQQNRPGCVSFAIGQVHVSEGARAALDAAGATHDLYLERHRSGAWEGTPPDEQEENHAAIREGRGVFTMHTLRGGARLWIVTREDRSRTVIFLPDEV